MFEQKIDQLRGFERTYRQQLKAYLEGQLDELSHTAVQAPADPSAPESTDTETEDSSGDEHS